MLTPSIRVLSLDGGGARCLSGLVILEELIQHIEEDHHDSPLGDSRPYYYFDLICGTEWGAVIALMLGRLRMTINECILWFQRNAFHYTPWFWESRDFSNSDRCEKALDALFAEEPLYEAQPKQGHVCHIVVLVTDLENLGTPERLRSYTSKTYGKAIVSRCTILQAALASIATPMRTRGVRIDAMLCVSAAIAGFSNPALEALDEAASIWSSTKIYSFVSIGTGIQEPRDSASAGGRPRWLGYPSPKATMGLMRVITHMIIDPEHTAIELFRFSRAAGFLCSRFTLPTEFTSTTYKHEWTPVAFERVPKLTRLYLANSEITASLIVCANSLKPSKSLGTDGERGNPVFSSVDPPAVPSETMLDTLGPEFLVKCPSLKAVSTQSALSGTTEPFEGILFDEPTVRSDQKENLATDNYMKGLRARYQQLFKDAPEDIRKVKVAVLDSGIDSSHPFIEANWIRPRWGARGENGLPRKLDDDGYMDFTTESPLTKNGTDTCGHGTHVAGIILQLAPDAELHVGRVFRDKTFSKKTDPECTMRIAKAIRYAVDVWGVDVISMSFGFSSIPADVKEAIIYAYSKDRILVAAASNNGNSKVGNVTYPASHLGLVICINAANYAGTPYEFNPPATSSKDNFTILGEAVKSTWSKDAKRDANQEEPNIMIEEGAWKRASGTSVATPVASAVVAQLIYWKRIHRTHIRNYQMLENFGGIRQMLISMVDRDLKDVYQYILPENLLDPDVKTAISGVFSMKLRQIYS